MATKLVATIGILANNSAANPLITVSDPFVSWCMTYSY